MPRKPRFGSIYRRKKRIADGRLAELPTWWIQFTFQGRKVRESSKSDRYSDAERLLKRRLLEIASNKYGGPQAEQTTVGELLNGLMTDYEQNQKSVQWLREVDKKLRPFWGKLRATAVYTPSINAYIESRRNDGVSNSTINRELALLRRAFNLAAQESPPRVVRVPRFPHLKEPPPRPGFFTFEEFTGIKSALPDYLVPLVTVAYNTGCRRGELLSLRWSQVDFDGRAIRLERTKNGEPRNLPLTTDLYELLRMMYETREANWPECEWVFSRNGQRIRSFKNAWERACKAVGIRKKNQVSSLWDTEREKPNKLFHDLRRTGVRNLVRAGVPERVAMAISGHKTRSVFDRYNIVSERDLVDAAYRLEHYLDGLQKGHTDPEMTLKGHTPGTLETTGENTERASAHKLLN